MSNHSHLHLNESGQEVDAFGLRSECDVCRARAGLPSMAEAERAKQGVTLVQGGGQAPDDELLAELTRAEQENDTLRLQLRDAGGTAARERDAAVAQVGTLQRQVTALEKQVAQLPMVEGQLEIARAESAKASEQRTVLEGQLTIARDRIAALEQQLAAATKKTR